MTRTFLEFRSRFAGSPQDVCAGIVITVILIASILFVGALEVPL